MTLKGHNKLWNGMFQAISGRISKMVRGAAMVTVNH